MYVDKANVIWWNILVILGGNSSIYFIFMLLHSKYLNKKKVFIQLYKKG